MYGKYFEKRVHPLFVRTYSRVPNLDSEIFYIENQLVRDSYRAKQCVKQASDGLSRTFEKSEQLSKSLATSRLRREQDAACFLNELEASQRQNLEKQKECWKNYDLEKNLMYESRLKSSQHLQNVLKSNSTKADSRRASVRRWAD